MTKISDCCREAERKVLRLLHDQTTRANLTPIHGYFLRRGLHCSNQILAHFVSICGSLNKMPYAEKIFSQTLNPSILLFNSMIKGFSLNGPYERSVDLFYEMKSRSIWPDEYTYVPMLKSCSNLKDVRTGEEVHARLIRWGFEFFNAVQIGVVELYTVCGRMRDAEKVFDEMSNRDVIVWNLMVCGFCRAGKVDMGIEMFKRMGFRNIVSWNTMISCLRQSGRDKEALQLFQEMREEGVEPDEATIVTLLPICARSGATDLGQQLLSVSESTALLKTHVSLANSTIDFHCKSGDLETAMKKFEETPKKNVVTWNTMISGAAYNGKSDLGIDLYKCMIANHVTPNETTFVAVLTCCSHSGLVDMARELFTSMATDHGIEPQVEHYGCMVDVLSRSGCMDEAYGLIKKMRVEPNAALWGSILSGCRLYGDLEMAEVALKELVHIEKGNSGNYVLLSNLYADSGRWGEVDKIRGLMKENVVNKGSGNSAIS